MDVHPLLPPPCSPLAPFQQHGPEQAWPGGQCLGLLEAVGGRVPAGEQQLMVIGAGGTGTKNTDPPLLCLSPAQGSHSCRQPVPRGLTPRGQGSLEQERRWKQYLEDERIALFLQNEEFMKELQRNRDFLLALERGEKCLQDPLPPLLVCMTPVMLISGSIAVPMALWLVPKQRQCRMQPDG